MKVITLNTWGGRAGKENLLNFFRQYRDTTDIFCLQEIWSDRYENLEGVAAGGNPIDHSKIMVHGLQDIAAELPDHTLYFRPHFGDNYGLCTFMRNSIPVIKEGEIFVYQFKGYIPERESDIGNHARNIQFVTFKMDGKPITIINFHGLWNGKGKGDSEDRLSQSGKIIEYIRVLENPFVLCGDFNLTPDTISLRNIESVGLKNLIKTFGITSTRTSHYSKPEKYADYVLVSEGIIVKDFKVLPEEVSDHAALSLDFTL